jgi:hypothetical protein
MAEFDPNQEFDYTRTYTREQMDKMFADPNRKPLLEDIETSKFLDNLKFRESIKKYPLARMGLEGGSRGRARVLKSDSATTASGSYTPPLKELSDKQMILLMRGKSINIGGQKQRLALHTQDALIKQGATDPTSGRDFITLGPKGHLDDDIKKTETIFHEFRHRAIDIIKESRGIDIVKLTGYNERDLMHIMDFMHPNSEYRKMKDERNVPSHMVSFIKHLEKAVKDPKVLEGIVQIQQIAMEEMLKFSKKVAEQGPQKPDDGLGYSPEQEAQMKKEGR